MKTLYEDEMRVINENLIPEDTEEDEDVSFVVASTGAQLDLDNALPHLYHFCATLPAQAFTYLRPDFICSEAGHDLVRALVILPLSVDEGVRTAWSKKAWRSEKNAMKDAAFRAYVALYNAGLVNQNLLPLLRHDTAADDLTRSAADTRASIVCVREQLDPWIEVALANDQSTYCASVVAYEDFKITMHLPGMT